GLRPSAVAIKRMIEGAPLRAHVSRPTASFAGARALSGTSQIFIGRENELARLQEEWNRVRREGRGRGVLVIGESGVGKTALVNRFVRQVVTENAVALEGRCFEREAVPYKAIDGVMDSLGRRLARMPAAEAAALLPRWPQLLAKVFPVLLRVGAFSQAPAT